MYICYAIPLIDFTLDGMCSGWSWSGGGQSHFMSGVIAAVLQLGLQYSLLKEARELYKVMCMKETVIILQIMYIASQYYGNAVCFVCLFV